MKTLVNLFVQISLSASDHGAISSAELNERLAEFCEACGVETIRIANWSKTLSAHFKVRPARGIRYSDRTDLRGVRGVKFKTMHFDQLFIDGYKISVENSSRVRKQTSRGALVELFIREIVNTSGERMYTKDELQAAFDDYCVAHNYGSFAVHDWDCALSSLGAPLVMECPKSITKETFLLGRRYIVDRA